MPCVGGAAVFCVEAVDVIGPGLATAGVTGGGRTLTGACSKTCGATGNAAGATPAELANTLAGTTVAALRFANCWFATCGGGSTVPCVFTIVVILVILVTLTLAMLTLLMYVGSRV